MKRIGGFPVFRSVVCAAAMLCLVAAPARGDEADPYAGPAATLNARHAALKDALSNNQFRRPLHMNSSESATGVTGEIFALVNYPFATVGAAMNTPSQWCDILILHLNTKYCRPTAGARGTVLHVAIGKKFDQPVNKAYRLDFDYRLAARAANYLQVKLSADEGPLGTSNYRIVLEAAPAEDGQTFIRLAYSYSYGVLGQVAMRVYLGTVARDKVGFTQMGGGTDRQPHAIGGMRGIVERNTMRYYLAIEAYLGSLAAPLPARMEKSLRDWFTATESYPRQLHEVEQGDYLAMKRKEYARQQQDIIN